VWIFLIVVLMCLPIVGQIAAAQNGAQPTPSGTHVVQLVGPNDSGFETALDTDFPGLSGVNYFQAAKPLLVILHNPSPSAVRAYVVTWTVTNEAGDVSTANLPIIGEPETANYALTGQNIVLGAGATELVSPFFHWTKRQFPGLMKINAVYILLQSASMRPLAASVQNAATVHVALDGDVFDDGVFIGPDASKLFERFQGEQQAEVDEGTWAVDQLSSSTTTEEIQQGLSQQIYEGRNATGTDSASLYTAARGREASRLLGVLDHSGRTALQIVATRLSRAKPMTLSRQAGQ
jgi:hypothetical protein